MAPAASIISPTKMLHLLVLAPVLCVDAKDHSVLPTLLSAILAIFSAFETVSVLPSPVGRYKLKDVIKTEL